MKLNLPNQLTLLRLVLVPFFLVYTISDSFWTRVASLLVFILAAITDLLDGRLARQRNEVTTLGVFLDPLADKFLIASAFVAFVQVDEVHVPAWMVVLIIGREFLITGLRTLAASQGRILPAQPAGKFKTTSQMFAIITILVILVLNSGFEQFGGVSTFRFLGREGAWEWFGWVLHGAPYWLTFIVTVFTILSGVLYLRQNADLFDDQRPTRV